MPARPGERQGHTAPERFVATPGRLDVPFPRCYLRHVRAHTSPPLRQRSFHLRTRPGQRRQASTP